MPRDEKKPGQRVQHSGLVEAHDVHGVTDHVDARGTLFGAPHGDGQAGGFAQLVEFALELGQRVPVARDEQQHCKFIAERRHAAFEDVAAAFDHDAGQVVDQPGPVVANGADRDQLLHGCVDSV